MKAIVGLGNPGMIYARTKHNIGVLVVKAFCRKQKIKLVREKGVSAFCVRARIEDEETLLALPLVFMNLSGAAVKALCVKYKIDPQDLLVVCDDLDLEFTRIKLRPSGSSGGHRGLVSIIEALGTKEFCRLRIGIGRPPGHMDPAEYVLRPFSRKEKSALEALIQEAVSCCRSWLGKAIEESMSAFNRRSRVDSDL